MNISRPMLLALLLARIAVGQIPVPPDAPRPMSPEESAAAFQLPDGFRMEVVASEPLIASPSGVCWDERGRMFVSELHGYNLEGQLDIEELNKTGKLDTQVRRIQADERFKEAARSGTYGVVKLLHDIDRDGRMDKVDVWTTNLPPAYGLIPARGGIIVACAPHIIFLADRDGDGKAEVRETLFTGFRTGALERGVNSPQWGFDGWIYCTRGWGSSEVTGPKLARAIALPDSDFRFRADGTAIEPVTGRTHTFGFAMTEAGDRFVMSTATPGIYVAPLPWRYLARNPDVAFTSLTVETGDRRVYPMARPHPWRTKRAEDPGFFKYYRDRYGAGDSDASGWFTSACGPMIYHDSVLPGLHGQYFVCEPAGNLIHRAIIEQDGSMLRLRRAPGEEKSEFAASRDAWSHPISLAHGPDGAIWVVDYYREIIEDYSAIPRYLQQQYGLYAGHDRGRIYRLTHRDAARAPSANMAVLDSETLARECGSPILWRRQTAQRLLVERRAKSAVPVLREIVGSSNTRSSGIITALRTLDGLKELLPGDDVRPFLAHTNSAVVVHALELAERWFDTEEGNEMIEAARKRASSDGRVAIQLALSLGESRDQQAFIALADLVRHRLQVRWMDAAVLSSLHGRGAKMLAELARNPGDSQAFLPRLTQMINATRNDSELFMDASTVAMALPPIENVSDETFRKFRSALAAPRNVERGQAIFRQACALCHRVGGDGYDVGADLMAQIGMPEESLLQDILMPNARIRPGFETALVEVRSGTGTNAAIGLLKEEGATSLTLVSAGGLEQVILRKDVVGVRRLSQSLMPSFAEGLAPAEVADVLAWLVKQQKSPK